MIKRISLNSVANAMPRMPKNGECTSFEEKMDTLDEYSWIPEKEWDLDQYYAEKYEEHEEWERYRMMGGI